MLPASVLSRQLILTSAGHYCARDSRSLYIYKIGSSADVK